MHTSVIARAAGCLLSLAALNAAFAQYTNTVLVANDPIYQPTIQVDFLLQNPWGMAIRPPGAGGHFWLSNFGSGTTTTYIGDVHTPTGFLPLYQDSLKVVGIELGSGIRDDGRPRADPAQPTGQVYNYSTTDFVVSGQGITAASKFIFVTGEGTISGWTERTDEQGVLRRQFRSVITIDQSSQYDDDRLRYTGCAITDYPSNNRLYVTNWIENRVEVYDHLWQPVATQPGAFTYPGQGGDYYPFNIQYFRTGPNGEGRLWVAYAQADDPWEQHATTGAVAEFDLDGTFIRRLVISPDTDGFADSELRNPWGLAIAPANFGPLSNTMLVANFGDGTIAGFDLTTMQFVDFLRDNAGEPIIVDGIWGMTFGNGVRLGDLDALYYAAGPNSEIDGTFGSIRLTSTLCPVIATQPAPLTQACPGDSVTLTIAAPGPAAQTYQWERLQADQWLPLTDGPVEGVGIVGGSTSPHLTLAAAVASATLRCTLSTPCGSLSSDISQLSITPCGPACNPDMNADGVTDQGDVDFLVNVIAGADNPANIDTDFNHDGVSDQGDIDALVDVVAGGSCP